MGCRTAEAWDMHHGPLCLRSHTRVTICAASASRGVGGLGQMGERVVSSGHAVA